MSFQLKKVHWKANCHVLIVTLGWATLIGQASNAAVVAGSLPPFKSTKAE